MTVHLKQEEIAAFDRTAEATLTPVATVAPRGVRIDVNELSGRSASATEAT
jgi:type II secretory pathway component PulK